MITWAKLILAVTNFLQFIASWFKEEELKNEGRQLQAGEDDAATLEELKQAHIARDREKSDPAYRSMLDGELDVDRVQQPGTTPSKNS